MTIQVRFCPNDGTERVAKFCAKCGFNFEQAVIGAPTPPRPVIRFEKADRTGEPAGWYPDPLNADRFRQWDGYEWADEHSPTPGTDSVSKAKPAKQETVVATAPKVEPKRRVLLEGLAYGADFKEGASCYNCGNTIVGLAQCPLCGREV